MWWWDGKAGSLAHTLLIQGCPESLLASAHWVWGIILLHLAFICILDGKKKTFPQSEGSKSNTWSIQIFTVKNLHDILLSMCQAYILNCYFKFCPDILLHQHEKFSFFYSVSPVSTCNVTNWHWHLSIDICRFSWIYKWKEVIMAGFLSNPVSSYFISRSNICVNGLLWWQEGLLHLPSATQLIWRVVRIWKEAFLFTTFILLSIGWFMNGQESWMSIWRS